MVDASQFAMADQQVSLQLLDIGHLDSLPVDSTSVPTSRAGLPTAEDDLLQDFREPISGRFCQQGGHAHHHGLDRGRNSKFHQHLDNEKSTYSQPLVEDMMVPSSQMRYPVHDGLVFNPSLFNGNAHYGAESVMPSPDSKIVDIASSTMVWTQSVSSAPDDCTAIDHGSEFVSMHSDTGMIDFEPMIAEFSTEDSSNSLMPQQPLVVASQQDLRGEHIHPATGGSFFEQCLTSNQPVQSDFGSQTSPPVHGGRRAHDSDATIATSSDRRSSAVSNYTNSTQTSKTTLELADGFSYNSHTTLSSPTSLRSPNDPPEDPFIACSANVHVERKSRLLPHTPWATQGVAMGAVSATPHTQQQEVSSSSSPSSSQMRASAPIKPRQRNRTAANKCRERTKAAAADLEATERAMSSQHEELTAQAMGLRDQVLQLKSELLLHGNCDCPIIQQYLKQAARNIGHQAPKVQWSSNIPSNSRS